MAAGVKRELLFVLGYQALPDNSRTICANKWPLNQKRGQAEIAHDLLPLAG
jgi:hypothetical protein